MATYKVVGVGQHGKYFDAHAYRDVINYDINPKKASFVGGAGVSTVEAAAQEMQETAIAYGKDIGKRIRHSVLSFDKSEHITPEKANEFAKKIIEFYASDFQIVYGVHANTDDLHIHFAMNQVSYTDGHRYDGKKKDYYAFKRHMEKVTHLPVILAKDKKNG